MYYHHFGLSQAPYNITPDTQLFYKGADRGGILDVLRYAILNGDAIIKVVGEVGSGKTMLCRMLQLTLPNTVDIVYLANPKLSPEEILQAIANELQLPAAQSYQAKRLDILKALQNYLLAQHGRNRQVVVFIEEAQGMPLETLEEIRLLSNLETQQHKLLQLVLFGQPELDDNLASPHVRQIKDRITQSVYLPPLRQGKIRDYLMFRLRQVGYRGPALFSRTAAALIAYSSKGLMRRINILADKALLAAYTQGVHRVTTRHVRRAIHDSEFASRLPGLRLAAGLALAGAAGILLAAALWPGASTAPEGVAATPAQASPGLIAPAQDRRAGKAARQPLAAVPAAAAVPRVRTTPLPPDSFQARLQASQTWLQNANPNHFSIQVLLTDADAIDGLQAFFVQKQVRAALPQLYLYRTKIKDKQMFGVLHGEYTTYSAAQQALRDLPPALHRYRPYLRSVRTIRAEPTW